MNVSLYLLDDMQSDLDQLTACFKEIELSSDFAFHIDATTDPSLLPTKEYDLYILDIDLNGQSGFDFASRLISLNHGDAKSKIIFCTSHSDLVFDSFNLDVFYFIRKEHLKTDLENALRKYEKESSRMIYTLQFDGKTRYLPLNDIIYIDVSRNYTFFHTAEEEYQQRKSLKQVMEELHCDFIVRISNYTAINLHFIDHFENTSIILTNGMVFAVAADRVNEVKDLYMKGLLWG
jgi:DNA-binding LytR/AlgR family response regulator